MCILNSSQSEIKVILKIHEIFINSNKSNMSEIKDRSKYKKVKIKNKN